MNYQTLANLASGIGSTVLGGGILAFLFFLIKEKCFPLPNVTGRWHVEMRTVKTAYNPYQYMVLQYVAMLWREGSKIKGTIEKVYENSSTGERNYVGQNRTRGEIEGYVDKRYFSKDQVSLHMWDLRCSGFWVPVSTMKGATRRRQPALGQSKERISLFRHNTAPIPPESLLSGRSNPSGVAYPSNCFA